MVPLVLAELQSADDAAQTLKLEDFDGAQEKSCGTDMTHSLTDT